VGVWRRIPIWHVARVCLSVHDLRSVLAERERRETIWSDLRTRGDATAASPELLSEIGLRPHKTGQGIYRDTVHTVGLAPHGITLSLLAHLVLAEIFGTRVAARALGPEK
jgi:hypothetical protein